MEEKKLQRELDKIFESFCEKAKGFFYSEGEVASFIFIFGVKKNQLAVLPAIPLSDGQDQYKFAQSIQVLCKIVNAVAGIVVGEAWIVRPQKDEIVLDGIVPSKRPDRLEALHVALFSKVLNKGRAWKIIREGKKQLEPLRDGNFNPIYSKFFGDYFNVDASENEGKEMKN